MPIIGYRPSSGALGAGRMNPGTTRASYLGGFREATWVTQVSWYGGRTEEGNASGGPAIYQVSGSDLTTRLWYGGAESVTAPMSSVDGSGGKLYTRTVTDLLINPGVTIAGAVVNAGATDLTYGQDLSGALMYFAASAAPSPWVESSRSPQGKVHVSVSGIANRKPLTPVVFSPASGGIESSPTPTITFIFRDPDEDLGDYIASYRIELWNQANTTRLYDSGFVPTDGTEQANHYAEHVVADPLTLGQLVRLRLWTYDRAGRASDMVSSTFTLDTTGSFIGLGVGDVAGQDADGIDVTNSTTPSLSATWEHEDALSATSHEYRIVKDDDGSVYRGPWTNSVFPVFDDASLLIEFHGPDPDWAPMAAGETTYRWEIRGTDSDGVTSAWSPSRPFQVNAGPVVVDTAPDDGAVTTTVPSFSASVTDGTDASETMREMQFEVEHIASTNTILLDAIYSEDDALWRESGNVNQTTAKATFFATNGYGDYRWRVIGEDPWGLPLSDSYRAILYTEPPQITLNAPVGTIVDATPVVDATIDTTLSRYRLTIRKKLTTSTIYDSGVLSAGGSTILHDIPGGVLFNRTDYILWIWVESTSGLINIEEHEFRLEFPADPLMTGVTGVAIRSSIYDAPQFGYPEQLPNADLNWTRVDESVVPDADWLYMDVRRISPSGNNRRWIIEDRNVTRLTDTTAGAETEHAYYIGYLRRTNFGQDRLRSAWAKVRVATTILHSTITSESADDPAVTLPFWRSISVTPMSDIRMVEVFGQRAPIAFQGERNYDVIDAEFRVLSEHGGGAMYTPAYTARDVVEDLRELTGPVQLTVAQVIINVIAQLLGGNPVGPTPRVLTYRDRHRTIPVVITDGPRETEERHDNRATFRLQLTETARAPEYVAEPDDDVVDVTDGYPFAPQALFTFDGTLAGVDSTNQPITATGEGAVRFVEGVAPGVQALDMWEATTNLHKNPSAEGAIQLGFGQHVQLLGSVAITQTTDQALVGTQSYKVVTNGAGPNEGGRFYSVLIGAVKVDAAYSCSLSVYGAGSLRLQVAARYNDTTEDIGLAVNITTTDDFTRFVLPYVEPNPAKQLDYIWVDVRQQGTTAGTFYVDAIQIEEKAYATAYADGSLGSGYAWTGIANNSTSTRATVTTESTLTDYLDPVQGSVTMRVHKDSLHHATALFQAGDTVIDGTDQIDVSVIGSGAILLFVGCDPAGASASNSTSLMTETGIVAADTWHVIHLWWDAINIGIKTGGQAWQKPRDIPAAGAWNGDTLRIGYASWGGQHNGRIGGFRADTRELTDAELAQLETADTWAYDTI